MHRFLVTGTAGFIGFHLARLLLEEGHTVHGYDALTDYYDVNLKKARRAILLEYPNYVDTEAYLEDLEALETAVEAAQPEVIVHLAAQAGVRYSIENPRAYVDANIIGTFHVMECARKHEVKHLLIASTSSVYGANTEMPYAETHKADTQMSFYAATKKANEVMAHTYAHIHGIPTTMFRFFTVYGPWSRPDMAPFRFTKAILEGKPIDVYNHGEMWRDFTYVDDLVQGIRRLIDAVPPRPTDPHEVIEGDSLSPVAPFRIVNIGNSDKVKLTDFIDALEQCLEVKATRNHIDMQPGDVPATWADAELLRQLTGYKPQTPFINGVQKFVEWYQSVYATEVTA